MVNETDARDRSPHDDEEEALYVTADLLVALLLATLLAVAPVGLLLRDAHGLAFVGIWGGVALVLWLARRTLKRLIAH